MRFRITDLHVCMWNMGDRAWKDELSVRGWRNWSFSDEFRIYVPWPLLRWERTGVKRPEERQT